MKLFGLLFFIMTFAHAQTSIPGPTGDGPVLQTPQEKELDVVDFSHVKDVLKKDGLSQEVRKKKEEVKLVKKVRVEETKHRYSWPTEEEFWPIAAEWWLVKNAPVLKWDFDRPEYGIEPALAQILKNTGYLQKKFRVLALDSTSIPHLGLPWTKDEFCFLFSVPFARTLDLSKLEISLLLLEDLLRIEEGWLQDFARPAKLKDLAGSTFEGKTPDMSPVFEVAKAYSTFTQEKGFTFQQQFKITKKMDSLLRPYPDLWNAYVRMLNKIDRLVKSNSLFVDYPKLYPSPEMQIKWLSPEEKNL